MTTTAAEAKREREETIKKHRDILLSVIKRHTETVGQDVIIQLLDGLCELNKLHGALIGINELAKEAVREQGEQK